MAVKVVLHFREKSSLTRERRARSIAQTVMITPYSCHKPMFLQGCGSANLRPVMLHENDAFGGMSFLIGSWHGVMVVATVAAVQCVTA